MHEDDGQVKPGKSEDSHVFDDALAGSEVNEGEVPIEELVPVCSNDAVPVDPSGGEHR